MRKISIDNFIAGLCSISEEDFDVDNVYDYLKENPVDTETLEKYVFFSKKKLHPQPYFQERDF